jgi:hypothetical protein
LRRVSSDEQEQGAKLAPLAQPTKAGRLQVLHKTWREYMRFPRFAMLIALATLLSSCGGGSGGGSPVGDVPSTAPLADATGVYTSTDPISSTNFKGDLLVDDVGHMIGTLTGFGLSGAQEVTFSGTAVKVGANGWVIPDAVLTTRYPQGTVTTTAQEVRGVYVPGASVRVTTPFLPLLPEGTSRSMTAKVLTSPPPPYSMTGIAGHYYSEALVAGPAFPSNVEVVTDFTLDAQGHFSGQLSRECQGEGTLRFADANKVVVTGTGSFSGANCALARTGSAILLGYIYGPQNYVLQLQAAQPGGPLFFSESTRQP